MNGSWRGEQQPVAPNAYRSARSLAGLLIGLLAMNAALDVVAAISDISYLGLLDRIATDGAFTFEEADTADTRQATLGIMQLISYALCAIAFIIWFRRSYRNLGPLGASWLRFKPGWAVGTWFVPFLNTIRAKEIANDIWRVSDPALPPKMEGPALGHPVAKVVDLWWIALLISGVIGRMILTRDAPTTVSEVQSATQLVMAGDLFDVVLSGLAIAVVKMTTDRQEQRHHRLQTSPMAPSASGLPPPPPPPPPLWRNPGQG